MRFVYVILSIAPIFLTIYSYNNHKIHFIEFNHFLKWFAVYAIPFTLVFFFFLIGAMKKEFPRVYSLVLIGCVIIPCYVFEYYLVKNFYSASDVAGMENVIKAAKKNNIKPDLRLQTDVVENLNQEGIESYPFFKVGMEHRIYPIGVIPNKTIVLCNELGEHTVYKSDRYGFNNPDEVWDQDKINVIFLGDSFTQGSCILDNKNFVNQNRTQDLNLINLGNGSNNPWQILIGLVEYAVPIRPKKIIWMHCSANDIDGLLLDYERSQKAGNEILDNYLYKDFSQNLINKTDEVEEFLLERYKNRFINFQRIHWPSFLKLSQLRMKLNLSFDTERISEDNISRDFEELFEKIIKKSKLLSESIGTEIHFVHIPTYTELVNGSSDEVEKVKNIIKKNKIPYYNLADAFKNESDLKSIFSWETTGHFSMLGNRLTAKFIKEKIIDN